MLSKYWWVLAAGAVGAVLWMRRQKASAVSGCSCAGGSYAGLGQQPTGPIGPGRLPPASKGAPIFVDPHSGLPAYAGAYGDIDALPQQQVYVNPLQRYERAGTR